MRLVARKYKTDDDYWKIRQFMRMLFLSNDRRAACWPLYRWDYWRWYLNENVFRFNLQAAVFLWETTDGQLAAVLHPAGAGEAFLQVHPDFRTPELDLEMVLAAETQFAVTQADGSQQLAVWLHASDAPRQDLLLRRGYARGQSPEYGFRRDLSRPLPDFYPPSGYTLRALGDADEHLARSWLSWRTAHPDGPDDKYWGWESYRTLQRAPLYRRDLDLVAVAPAGSLAAFCTLWFDDVTRTAAVEPLGTHPDHQGRGLARALLAEGLRRVDALGALFCLATSRSQSAGALFASLGFTEYGLCEPWLKTW